VKCVLQKYESASGPTRDGARITHRRVGQERASSGRKQKKKGGEGGKARQACDDSDRLPGIRSHGKRRTDQHICAASLEKRITVKQHTTIGRK